VLVFTNEYNGLFFDEKTAGLEMVQHGVRTATGGAIRLTPTPEQWDQIPKLVDRKVDKATSTIVATLRYEAFDFDSRLVVSPDGSGFKVVVSVDKPVPAALEGRAGLNLEFRPSQYWEHTYLVDGKPGIFPATPPADGFAASRKEDPAIRGLLDVRPPWARGVRGDAAVRDGESARHGSEDPERRVTIRAVTGELSLFDGRNLAQNGWYVVRTLLATGTTGTVAEWHVEPHAIPGWTRTPVIGFSQVGYHPSQPKRAVIELDANDAPLATASLLEVRPDGSEVEKLKAKAEPWGQYLRYNYVVADFSSVKDPGLYRIQYGTQKTGAFPIAADVYERVWHPTLDVFFPVQMDHMFVNEAYRVWHGAPHLDDARQAPLGEQHFDGYRTGDSTNSPYQPGERIPGLAVGGWFDAGDFDIQGGSHAATVASLAATWETFHPQHDQTLVDQRLRFVDIHRPDGKPDVLQQIEQGALQLAAQYRTIGRLVRGIVDGELHRYHHLGDASTQTDNLLYDPSLKPFETDGNRSGTPDDRWVYVDPTPGSNYAGSGRWPRRAGRSSASTTRSRRSASRSQRRRTREERARPPAPPSPTGGFPGFGPLAELSATAQLMAATKERPYVDRFNELVWPALDRNAGFALQTAVRAIPAMDAAYAAKLRPYVEKYKLELDGMLKQNPYGVPIATGGWAGSAQVIGWATTNYYLNKAYPDLVGTGLVTRGLDYVFGTHPAHNYSLVSAVGNRSKHVAYGNNRADFTFIAGGIVPGVLVLKPDYPENMDDWPFLWGENEYVIGIGASYIFLANAAQELLGK
jgi:hypothetical protein